MPCDTIQTTSVVFSIKTDRTLLTKALEAMGFIVTTQKPQDAQLTAYHSGKGVSLSYTYETGQLVLEGYGNEQELVSTIKRAYSAEVVKSQARRFGWTLKEVRPYEYQVMKR